MRTTSVSSDTPLVKPRPSCSCQHTNACLRQQSEESNLTTESTSSTEDSENAENQSVQKCITAPKIIITICILCVLFSIGSAVLTGLVFKTFNKQRSEEKSEFCLPCSHVLVENVQNEVLNNGMKRRIREEDGVQVCCAKDPAALESVLNQYLQMKIEDKNSEDNEPGVVNTKPFLLDPAHRTSVVAHVVLDDQPQPQSSSDDSRVVDITSWRHEPTRNIHSSVIKKHITYRRGRLVIEQAGLYYVYSQIHFLERHPGTRGQRSISHYIHKFNRNLPNGGHQLLLQNSRSRCQNGGGMAMEHSSYIGAVVKLNKFDEVYVKVNNIQAVHADSSSSYFGLYLVSKTG